MSEYSPLFQPLVVRRIKLRNRIVCPPMVTNRDIVGKDGIEWYRRMAEGGAGLVIVEATHTSRFGEDLNVDGLRRLVEAVKGEGAAVAIQLFMSPVDGRNSPDSLTPKDISLSVDRFRRAAAMCREAGFDGVEPHGAHGFLLNQFFSRRTNHRRDAYGGDLEGRMRLGTEVVRAVRSEVGKDMLVLYRHTPEEPGGYTLDESLKFAGRLVEAGVGLVPAGGGCKEMFLRNTDHLFEVPKGGLYPKQIEFMPFVARAFETIAMARVSTSGPEAVKIGYLKETDRMTVNRDYLMEDAKKTVLAMNLEGYRPPRPREEIRVPGENTFATIKLALWTLHEQNHITDHDVTVSEKIGYILCGGAVFENTNVSEQYLLDLEREAFLSLCGDPRTQARIQHMLTTGKPLRN